MQLAFLSSRVNQQIIIFTHAFCITCMCVPTAAMYTMYVGVDWLCGSNAVTSQPCLALSAIPTSY